jgi:dihydrofolate reductase/SAM-dependent methyltransferase
MNNKVTMIMVMTVDGIVVKNNEDVSEWTSLEDQAHLRTSLEKFDAMITGRKSFFGRVVDKPYFVLTNDKRYLEDEKIENEEVVYLSGEAGDVANKIFEMGYHKIALIGGPKTNYEFLKNNLVDDIYITVEPKMFGRGKHLNIQEELGCSLYLLDSKRMNSQGTMLLHYKVNYNDCEESVEDLCAPKKVPDMNDKELMLINRDFWNERAPLHEKSNYYNIDELKNGKLSLVDYEIEELGDIKGKNLIHLQCHIGTDTISLAKLGAKVTGLDYSESSIKIARELNDKCGETCEFVCSDVYEVRKAVGEKKFDIAYVNFGAITLLPDLNKWAKVIYEILDDDGYLYLNELHPVSSVLSVEEPLFVADYFSKEPRMFEESGSYADGVSDRFNVETKNNKIIVWDRTLGEIISIIAAQGFRIEFVHEYSGYVDQRFNYLEKSSNGLWYPTNGFPNTPATFSLKARKR